jgi:solute carrier family 8 (sodium/calcium exchanger)
METSICNGGTSLVNGGDGSDGGLFLPIGGNFEAGWGGAWQSFMYFMGLLYCFVGVMLIADVFMAAIEKITSEKVRHMDPVTKRLRTMDRWNPTVANLTLMALGSSAPEILLSVLELFTNSMQSGELGPSTIVGSAAFNLFVIMAVVVSCVPAGEERKIKELPVFYITAFFSVFAYMWLIVILKMSSPNVIEWWEGLMTFLFFPALCVIAWLADIGFFNRYLKLSSESMPDRRYFTPQSSPEEINEMLMQVRKKYGDGCRGAEKDLLMYEFGPPASRAMRRVQASRQFTKGTVVPAASERESLKRKACQIPRVSLEKHEGPLVAFAYESYRCYESDSQVVLVVTRSGDTSCRTVVNVKTSDGQATAGADYVAVDETLTFEPNETEKHVPVSIIDDDQDEGLEEFFVVLELNDDDESGAKLGDIRKASVVIIDDDHPGVLEFAQEALTVEESFEDMDLVVEVKRSKGAKGTVSCEAYTEDDSAVGGLDFEQINTKLVLPHGVASANLRVRIKAKGRNEMTETFRLILNSPEGGACFDELTDGGADKCICTVTIEGNSENQGAVAKIVAGFSFNQDQMVLGKKHWMEQFSEAIYVDGDLGSESSESFILWFCHVLIFPWKFMCACVPPPTYFGGWLAFVVALVFIGLLTAFIGDLATMLGCSIGMDDSITAITIVAIGTSLPDTFASRTAAIQDETADASIGNVTGSNSVNVFLGLGLPWMIGSFYWAGKGVPDVNDPADPWVQRGREKGWYDSHPDIRSKYPATFVVPAGSLATSVATYTVCAAVTIVVLCLRRWFVGCELGGPLTLKYLTSALFGFLWLLYIFVSILAN